MVVSLACVRVCVRVCACLRVLVRRENAHQWAAAQQQRHAEARRSLGGRAWHTSGLDTGGRISRANNKKHSGIKRSKSLEVRPVLGGLLLMAHDSSRRCPGRLLLPMPGQQQVAKAIPAGSLFLQLGCCWASVGNKI